MLQHVNKVLIAKTAPASYTTVDALAVGDVALFDEIKALLKTAAAAASAGPGAPATARRRSGDESHCRPRGSTANRCRRYS